MGLFFFFASFSHILELLFCLRPEGDNSFLGFLCRFISLFRYLVLCVLLFYPCIRALEGIVCKLLNVLGRRLLAEWFVHSLSTETSTIVPCGIRRVFIFNLITIFRVHSHVVEEAFVTTDLYAGYLEVIPGIAVVQGFDI